MADSEVAPPARPVGEERDGNVRALARGLAVLQVINRKGSVSMMEIARGAAIPYPTACRIVQTLIELGMVEREPGRKRYRPTPMVLTLSRGYSAEDELVRVARPYLVELTRRFLWPVSLSTRVGSYMMVRDSTHRLTTLTLHNYAPGFTLPIVECASGKAYLAFCDPEERALILQGLFALDGPAERMGRLLLAEPTLLERIRAQGHATQARNVYTAHPGKTSSLAVPVFRDDRVVGALALIFFASAMRMREAEERFAPALKATAHDITQALAATSRHGAGPEAPQGG
ncbi:MAG: helix-turn-helix domain-containing protein [Sphingomonadaceae bacterium]|uniref:IclR family transcriptional regulator domain-containing protein n=1 Tax=Thermaurantiacus sp. TaxID=2820283 RepID=UPI00298EDC80|nr:helix-turn-helix domain-containing protein [Thermaurantiacus sp.]MCS6987573.1 helix-turn-helix domain-containing protein [Sphingomonadaceae bacterium]MDW8415174.1 helix-turn-helix domain-containing protein [Thermaurantiacus sp.]